MTVPIILNNRYQLEDRLGSGGMSMVFRARDLMLERIVAIKILRKDYSNNPEFRERFRQEAKAAANLSHPNIVTVHDFGLDSNQLFIVMEYVPGTDLKTLLKQRGHLNVPEVIELMSQACAGIGYAHRAGLIHCDVKPQNMLVTPEMRLKVVDFGIARALASISPDEQSDIVWGSPQYFSPEQAAGGAPSPASDVYSLGVVLYEMLTGQLPFTAPTPVELASLHRDALPPSPRKYDPSIPVALEQIVLKVLSKEPSARYRTADQLGRVLTGLNQHVQPPVFKPAPQYPQPEEVQPTPAPIPVSAPPAEYPYSPPIPWERPPSPATDLHIKPLNTAPDFDWLTWVLVLIALIAAGGLIPFWLWVYYVLNPPL